MPHPRRTTPFRHAAFDSLEARTLFAAAMVTPILNTSGDASGTPTSIDLASVFADDNHSFINFHTDLGDYRVELFDQQKPITVRNFLKYIGQKRLDGTIIHRSDILAQTDANDQPP